MCSNTQTRALNVGAFFIVDYLKKIFFFYREFFGQGWMKNDKNERTPYIMKTTKHFNDVCVYSGVVNKKINVYDR